jgi:dolichyl-phosphate-mannose--protein O-mannosyl transferase
MAVGIGVFGDQPMGWRVMSTVFGSLTSVGLYLFALILFQSQEAALWTLGITLANQLLYVQSRIGMLDTFMFGFLIWAMVAYFATWLPPQKRWKTSTLLRSSGALLGFAVACKWFAVIAWAACVFLFIGLRLSKITRSPWQDKSLSPENLVAKTSWIEFTFSLILIPTCCYFSTFLPYLFVQNGMTHPLLEILEMQSKMYDLQLRVVSSHPYMSDWTAWPLMLRTIWYAFEPELGDPSTIRGVILLGNPLIMWLGLLALIPCLIDAFRRKNFQALIIPFFYGAFYFCWSIIPRKIAFYYYYYPSGMILSFALAYVFFQWKAPFSKLLHQGRWYFLGFAWFIFFYFFPILAGLPISNSNWQHWMWFRGWI